MGEGLKVLLVLGLVFFWFGFFFVLNIRSESKILLMNVERICEINKMKSSADKYEALHLRGKTQIHEYKTGNNYSERKMTEKDLTI